MRSFDISAEFYDILQAGRHTTGVVEAVVGSLSAQGTPMRMVDVGAGTGANAVAAAALGAEVVAIEPNHSMRTALHARLAQHVGLVSQVTVIPHDVFDLPKWSVGLLADVDVVFAVGVLYQFDDDSVRRLVDLAARWLRPGGLLVVDGIVADGVSGSDGVSPPMQLGPVGVGALRYSGTIVTTRNGDRLVTEVNYEVAYGDAVVARHAVSYPTFEVRSEQLVSLLIEEGLEPLGAADVAELGLQPDGVFVARRL